jgi:hypothetical protein
MHDALENKSVKKRAPSAKKIYIDERKAAFVAGNPLVGKRDVNKILGDEFDSLQKDKGPAQKKKKVAPPPTGDGWGKTKPEASSSSSSSSSSDEGED